MCLFQVPNNYEDTKMTVIERTALYPNARHPYATNNHRECCYPSTSRQPFWVPCCDVRYDLRKKTMFGLSLPPLFVGGLMSYLRYLCLFAYSGVQQILCCVFVFVFFVLCDLCCQFLWIVQFWLPLRYSLPFIYTETLVVNINSNF